MSTKTIYQDIELLEDYVVNYQVTIERLPSLGIKLIGDRKNVEHLISSVENYLEKDIYSPEKDVSRSLKKFCLVISLFL
ncbi:hypothetical protein LOS19_14170 [Enterococcus faecium]|nr:hypothetical protein [Enterococcus faecium]